MLPGLGTLNNSGSMPINAGGGAAGPSEAKSTNKIGGAGTGNISFGGTDWKSLSVVGAVLVLGLVIWTTRK